MVKKMLSNLISGCSVLYLFGAWLLTFFGECLYGLLTYHLISLKPEAVAASLNSETKGDQNTTTKFWQSCQGPLSTTPPLQKVGNRRI